MNRAERAVVSARTFIADWDAWRERRRHVVLGPTGPASLVRTVRLGAEPVRIEGAPGAWSCDDGAVLGEDVARSGLRTVDGVVLTGDVRLRAGEEVGDGVRTLRAHPRGDRLAIRFFDAERPRREGVTGVLAYPPESRWVIGAEVRPLIGRVDVRHVDGSRSWHTQGALVRFRLDGADLELDARATVDGIDVVFADAGGERAHHPFRFLHLPPADPAGRTLVDFNRATLPPCAFSDQFACPLPSDENVLPVLVAAGERRPRRR